MKRVVITGVGMVSPNGNSSEKVWDNVSNLQNGMTISDFSSTNFVGLVDEEFNAHLNTKEKRYMNKCAQLALIASREAMKDANMKVTDDNCEDVSILIGSSVGGISAFADEFSEAAIDGINQMTMLAIPRSLINMIPANISIDLGIKGETLSYSNACASGTVAIGEAFKKIQHGDQKVVLAGGTEACVIPQVLESFRKLRAMSSNESLDKASVPFSKERSGFVMSEGAAMLILEEYDHAIERGANIYCEVYGYGSSTDAHSLLAPDLKGIRRCMENAIADAQVSYNDVEYINAHGTSTKLNDSTEAQAIEELFSHSSPLVSSTKSLHGHALGAAGAIELAICTMMIKNKLLIPTINVKPSEIDSNMSLNFLLKETSPYYDGKILSNSFAFGGHNASLVIGKVNT